MSENSKSADPWTPVDQSATTLEEVKPSRKTTKASKAQEVKGGNVTAKIDLGNEKPSEEELKAAADDSDTEDAAKPAEPTKEQALAEKLAALDAVKKARGKK